MPSALYGGKYGSKGIQALIFDLFHQLPDGVAELVYNGLIAAFDVFYHTEFGTTYNSYVYGAGDKTILFETAKAKYFDEYLKVLEEVTDVKNSIQGF